MVSPAIRQVYVAPSTVVAINWVEPFTQTPCGPFAVVAIMAGNRVIATVTGLAKAEIQSSNFTFTVNGGIAIG